MKNFKRVIVLLIFIAFCFLIYKFTLKEKELENYHFRDDFNNLNMDFWYIGDWENLFSCYEDAILDDGVLILKTKEVDKGPILISKPLSVKKDEILNVKRRVKLHYGNDHFTGGFVLFETKNSKLRPYRPIGNALSLIEYVRTKEESKRPGGNEIFRVLPRNFEEDFAIMDPIFNKWFIEEIIYDAGTGDMTYKINNKEYNVKAPSLTDNYIRLYMHAYGYYTGHEMDIDWIEINITKKE